MPFLVLLFFSALLALMYLKTFQVSWIMVGQLFLDLVSTVFKSLQFLGNFYFFQVFFWLQFKLKSQLIQWFLIPSINVRVCSLNDYQCCSFNLIRSLVGLFHASSTLHYWTREKTRRWKIWLKTKMNEQEILKMITRQLSLFFFSLFTCSWKSLHLNGNKNNLGMKNNLREKIVIIENSDEEEEEEKSKILSWKRVKSKEKWWFLEQFSFRRTFRFNLSISPSLLQYIHNWWLLLIFIYDQL